MVGPRAIVRTCCWFSALWQVHSFAMCTCLSSLGTFRKKCPALVPNRCQLPRVFVQVHCHTRGGPPRVTLRVQRSRQRRDAALQRRHAALVDVDSAACNDAALLRELAALKALLPLMLSAPVEAAPEPEPCLLDPAAGDPWGGEARLSKFCS